MFKLMYNYTLKTLFRKCRFTLASIISIVLFVSSIISIFILCTSVYESYKSYLYDSYGEYTGVVQVTTDKMLQELENSPSVLEHSVMIDYGTIKIPEQLSENNFGIAYMEDSALALANIKLLDGRLPKTTNEVLIEENLLQKLGGNATINSSFQFSIDIQGEPITKEYIIVGIIKNYSSFQLMNIGTKTLWPSVIMTTQDTTLNPNEVYSTIVTKSDDISFWNFYQKSIQLSLL